MSLTTTYPEVPTSISASLQVSKWIMMTARLNILAIAASTKNVPITKTDELVKFCDVKQQNFKLWATKYKKHFKNPPLFRGGFLLPRFCTALDKTLDLDYNINKYAPMK